MGYYMVGAIAASVMKLPLLMLSFFPELGFDNSTWLM